MHGPPLFTQQSKAFERENLRSFCWKVKSSDGTGCPETGLDTEVQEGQQIHGKSKQPAGQDPRPVANDDDGGEMSLYDGSQPVPGV